MRIVVHIQQVLNSVYSQVLVRTVDTKVFVIMIGLFHAQFGHGEICPVYQCEFHL